MINIKDVKNPILLLDDDSNSLYAMQESLKCLGRPIVTSSCAKQALNIAKNQKIELFLVDVKMPGMDGFEFTRTLRGYHAYQQVPILFITGVTDYQNQCFVELGFELGAIDYIFKPIDPHWLLHKVVQLLKLIEAQWVKVKIAQEKALRVQQQKHNQILNEKNKALARSNQELEQYAYVVSHDLKSPLRTIKYYSQRLLDEVNPSHHEKAKTYVNFIQQSVTESNALLDGLLKYSRLGKNALDLQAVSLAEVLTVIQARYQFNQAKIDFSNLGTVLGNKMLLQQVFDNLISNGLKFNKCDTPAVRIYALDRGADLEIIVTDNGIGIPQAYMKKVFDLFFRLDCGDFEGSGIGLAIVSKAVELMNGRIWVEPQQVGAQVHLRLPKARLDSHTPVRATQTAVNSEMDPRLEVSKS